MTTTTNAEDDSNEQHLFDNVYRIKSYKRWKAPDGFIAYQFYVTADDEVFAIRINRTLLMGFLRELVNDEQREMGELNAI